MSEIFNALQALALEQDEHYGSTNGSRIKLVASTVNAGDFSVLKEFTEPQASNVEEQEQQPSANQPAAEDARLTASADGYSVLEERIVRVVGMVKQERQARAAAEERAVRAEAKSREHAPRMDALEKELSALKREHDYGHQSVERMLNLLDSL
jgi:DNA-binding SARP family transcriptional activator